MTVKKTFSLLAFGRAAPEGMPVIAADKLPELTATDIKNGWTLETLARYQIERDRAAYKGVFEKPKPRQPKAQSEFNPHRW